MGPTRENLSSGFANNKGTDQPAHPRRLISAFVNRFLESIIYKLATMYMRNFNLLISLCSWGDWFESRFVGTPKTTFVVSRANYDNDNHPFQYYMYQVSENQWRNQNAVKVTHIKGRLLDQAVILFNGFSFHPLKERICSQRGANSFL